jgi:hypothetical protein
MPRLNVVTEPSAAIEIHYDEPEVNRALLELLAD